MKILTWLFTSIFFTSSALAATGSFRLGVAPLPPLPVRRMWIMRCGMHR